MNIFYTQVFDSLISQLNSLKEALNIKVTQLGDLSRIPTQDKLDGFLNAIILRPVSSTFEWYDSQRRIQRQITFWELYYIKRWVPDLGAFPLLINEGERIKVELEKDKNLIALRLLRLKADNSEGKVYDFRITEVRTDNDAEIYFKTKLADITAILINFEIEILASLKNKEGV